MKTKLLLIAPALLLVGVAGIQLMRARTTGLTPWKGGGFGMFSTVDSGRARFLRAYLVTGSGDVPIDLPADESVRQLVRRVQALAHERDVRQLAALLARITWIPTGATAATAAPIPDPGGIGRRRPLPYRPLRALEPAPAPDRRVSAAVRLELWRYQFEPATRTLVARRSMSVVAPPPSPRSAEAGT